MIHRFAGAEVCISSEVSRTPCSMDTPTSPVVYSSGTHSKSSSAPEQGWTLKSPCLSLRVKRASLSQAQPSNLISSLGAGPIFTANIHLGFGFPVASCGFCIIFETGSALPREVFLCFSVLTTPAFISSNF